MATSFEDSLKQILVAGLLFGGCYGACKVGDMACARRVGSPVGEAALSSVRSFYYGYEFGGGWRLGDINANEDTIVVSVMIPNGEDYKADGPSQVRDVVTRIACAGSIRGGEVWNVIKRDQRLLIRARSPKGDLMTVECPRRD